MTDNSLERDTLPHNLVLEDRAHLTLSGVQDVSSFDEETIAVVTDLGELTLKGQNLHINRLSLEMGEMVVDGEISALLYAEPMHEKEGSLFKRMFRT